MAIKRANKPDPEETDPNDLKTILGDVIAEDASSRRALPPDSGDALAGISRALSHGNFMAKQGALSAAEVKDLEKAALSERINHLSGDDFDKALNSGELDKARELAGYEDDEDPSEADARRAGVVHKVFVHMLALAGLHGAIDPSDALDAIAEHTDVPEEGDNHELLTQALANASKPGQALPTPAGQRGMTDEELDEQLKDVLSGNGAPSAMGGQRTVSMPDSR